MSIQTSPIAIVQAPAERIWQLLTTPTELERWSGTRLLLVPTRPLMAGDRLVLGAGIGGWIRVTFQVIAMERPRRLDLDISLPLGIVNHETVFITQISPPLCRVRYD